MWTSSHHSSSDRTGHKHLLPHLYIYIFLPYISCHLVDLVYANIVRLSVIDGVVITYWTISVYPVYWYSLLLRLLLRGMYIFYGVFRVM